MAKNKKEEIEKETDETAEASEVEEKETEEAPAEKHAEGGKQPFLKRLWQWVCSHKKVSVPLAALVVLGVLAAVPFTRYALAGMFVQQSVTVRVVDADTNKPVSSANVRLAGKQATTDNKGQATIRTNIGEAKLEVSKKYYQTTSREVLVPFKRSLKLTEVKLKATGRTVPVKVLNKVSGKVAANATIKTEGTEAKTDRDGIAMLVVPADKKELTATISGEGFNSQEVKLQVTSDEVPANTFELTPAGKVYFLSNQSGKIDVVKTNLDGTDRKIVLAGTGKEDKGDTHLFTSADQKHVVLLSKRDGGTYAKLFLINTANDQTTTLDEGDATFVVVGWSGSYFVYEVERHGKKPWDQKLGALKSYDANAKKIILLDEVSGDGNEFRYVQDTIGRAVLFKDEVVYSRGIYADKGVKAEGREASLSAIKRDGNGGRRKLNTSVDPNAFANWGPLTISYDIQVFDPGKLYFINHRDANKLYEYEAGNAKEVPGKSSGDIYEYDYKMFFVSPDGKKTVWAEQRDGKSATFIGDLELKNEKRIGDFDESSLSGWYTNDYLLISEKSTLFVVPAGESSRKEALKVSDYMRNLYH